METKERGIQVEDKLAQLTEQKDALVTQYSQPLLVSPTHRTYSPKEYTEMLPIISAMGKAMFKAAWNGLMNEEQGIFVIMYCYERGFPLTAAFDLVHPINTDSGKSLSLSPKGALALVLRSGLLEQMKIVEYDGGCAVQMIRKGGLEYVYTFTREDAKRAGLIKDDINKHRNSAYYKYERNMYKWRAIGFCVDTLFADVQAGLLRADNFGGIPNDQGDIVTFAHKEGNNYNYDEAIEKIVNMAQ